jgi:hypothetical protein
MKRRAVLLTAAAIAAPSVAMADRYEATITVRPLAGSATVREDGAPSSASVTALGLAGGLSWGLRNWLDVGADLAAINLPEATFAGATAPISGTPHTGDVTRASRLALLRLGATLRLGVGWVPTLHASLGPVLRTRTDAVMVRDASGPLGIIPDNGHGGASFDVAATLRAGFEHRLTRRWSVGVDLGVTHLLGLGAPSVDVIEGAVSVGYTWYPLW